MNSSSSFEVIVPCHALRPDDPKDTAWIRALEFKLNPYLLEPSASASIAINHSWSSVLSALILRDIQQGALGPRVHVWKPKRCVVVYNLLPMPHGIDRAWSIESSSEDGLIPANGGDAWRVMCLQSARNATWIYCPDISNETDAELPSHIQQIVESCHHNPIHLVKAAESPVIPAPDSPVIPTPVRNPAPSCGRSYSYLSFGSSSLVDRSFLGDCSDSPLSISPASFLGPFTPSACDSPIIMCLQSPYPLISELGKMTPTLSDQSIARDLNVKASKQLYDAPRRPSSMPTYIPAITPSTTVHDHDEMDPVRICGPRLVMNSPVIRSSFYAFGGSDDDLDFILPFQRPTDTRGPAQLDVAVESKGKVSNSGKRQILAKVVQFVCSARASRRIF
ncbi:uncharacterized protein EI90DRAFT_3062308 [Cantharellus anzutake]|uniref:uncharacterized protein n=1 Tax=Cantharellus anzutake TaxID=1750568 RepID=UPI001904BC2D|nr:uncharacterized protein EI90DRAFT_3062308 [Cantharellus anzutake]KAF8329345.1 hypothetical protein EI90DRAFT_3062308 [Cantharellus anzutake]